MTHYLLSQSNSSIEELSRLEYFDPSHMDNFFEIEKITDLEYKIVNIYKNEGTGKFHVNDIIYFGTGSMIEFYTKNDEIECCPTFIYEKNKIKMYNKKIEDKIIELVELIDEYELFKRHQNIMIGTHISYDNVANYLRENYEFLF